MVPHPLRSVLSVLRAAAFIMLLRSVAFDRWITVAATVVLLVAAAAIGRGRTWGVALSLLIGATLFGVWVLGIAPTAFAVVGVLAAMPFLRLARDFARFDRAATAALASLAVGFGGLGAVAWKNGALDLFRQVPLLAPSITPHHGLAVLAMMATAIALSLRRKHPDDEHEMRMRVASVAGPRVAAAELDADTEDFAEDVVAEPSAGQVAKR